MNTPSTRRKREDPVFIIKEKNHQNKYQNQAFHLILFPIKSLMVKSKVESRAEFASLLRLTPKFLKCQKDQETL